VTRSELPRTLITRWWREAVVVDVRYGDETSTARDTIVDVILVSVRALLGARDLHLDRRSWLNPPKRQ
jgi:hypothetical protein